MLRQEINGHNTDVQGGVLPALKHLRFRRPVPKHICGKAGTCHQNPPERPLQVPLLLPVFHKHCQVRQRQPGCRVKTHLMAKIFAEIVKCHLIIGLRRVIQAAQFDYLGGLFLFTHQCHNIIIYTAVSPSVRLP